MTIEVNKIKLHCRVSGDGPPLLFIHGFPLSGEMWAEVEPSLNDRWKCIVPDLRGHGKSAVTAGTSISAFADDLVGMLDQLREWRPAVCIGLSMGGLICFELFRRYRDRVRALVLCDCRANPETDEGRQRREQLAQTVLRHGSLAAADVMVPQLFGKDAPPQVRQHWHEIISRTNPAGVAAAARALADRPDSQPTLSAIDCPTLLIVGDEDVLTPAAMMQDMAAKIRSAKIEIIPGAGHMPPVEAPARFAEALRGFLTSVDQSEMK